MLPSDFRHSPLHTSTLSVVDTHMTSQLSNPNRTLLVSAVVDANTTQSYSLSQHQTRSSLVPPPSRHQLLRNPYDQEKINVKEMNPHVSSALLWRRNNSELDLEGKLSQESEVGYKWMPPAPAKKVRAGEFVP